MKYCYTLTLFFICIVNLSAQCFVQGQVTDEEKVSLTGATVVLLDDKDSSMIAFSITDSNGQFGFEDIKTGKYILQISFLSFSTYKQPLIIQGESKNIDIGIFNLASVSEVLQEVTVKAEHIPMGLIGDTISYNASAFKVRSGATVEDLLKKLPGIEVQRDGSIKAMGEDVENVLVDGREFFGDDPKIATQNLEAEAVDKVELFDKKSEIAEFTGIDDGDEEKTINLKLKEEYKRGGFGNLELAGGTDSRHQSKLNYNRFSPRMQAAAIISANNINKQAFTFSEYVQFMGGLGNAMNSNMNTISFGEFGAGLAPQGLTEDISGGLNFNYDFSKKVKLSSYYFYSDSDRNLENSTHSNQFTEATNFISDDTSLSRRINQNHRLNFKLDLKPSPFLQIIWKNSMSGLFGNLASQSSTSFVQSARVSGQTSSILTTSNDQLGYDGNIQLRKRFEKKGRNWINTFTYQVGAFDETNDVFNQYVFGSNASTLRQLQEYHFEKNVYALSSSYTEPLGRQFYLGFNYTYDIDHERPGKKFFDITEEMNIEQSTLNKDLSDIYNKTNHVQTAFLSIKKNNKKLKSNLSFGIQKTNILGDVGEGKSIIKNNSTHFVPSLRVEYDLTSDQSIRVEYNTSLNLPTLNQLAPLPDNSNANFSISGNPDLIPEYMHNFAIGYNAIDQFNFKYFFFNARLDRINNRIINKVTIDENLLKMLTPENTENYTRLTGFTSYSAPIRLLKLKYDISSQFSWSTYESAINELTSNVHESNIYLKFLLENRVKDHVDIAAGIQMDYSIRNYDINDKFNQQFFNTRFFIDGSFFIGKDWTINSSFDFVSYSGEFFSDSQKFNLWNTSIRKSFADDKFAIELTFNDLLNQNKGIRRSGDINSLYESRYNTLARYFMIGLKYKFGRRKTKEGISLG